MANAKPGEIVPRRGMTFAHARFLLPDLSGPMPYVVTRVAQGTVYYRPVDGGNAMYIAVEKFATVVKELLAPSRVTP